MPSIREMVTSVIVSARTELPRATFIAAVLEVCWGVVFGIAGVSLGIPAIARNGVFSGQAAFHLMLAVLAGAMIYSGLGLSTRRPGARIVASASGIVTLGVAVAVPAPLLLVTAAVNLTIIFLLVANRRRPFDATRSGAS